MDRRIGFDTETFKIEMVSLTDHSFGLVKIALADYVTENYLDIVVSSTNVCNILDMKMKILELE
jgi:hypothetical protein